MEIKYLNKEGIKVSARPILVLTCFLFDKPLWPAPLWPNAQFGPIYIYIYMPTTGPLEWSTHAEEAIFDQQRPNCLPSTPSNTRPHTSLVTRQKLRELGWEVLLRPPYSPDLAPSDYHLFLSMANELGTRKLATRESCENWLSEFFDNREASFYKRGIRKLPSRWVLVFEQNGAYLT